MATYIVRIQLHSAGTDAYHVLDNFMQKENFIPVNASASNEKVFSYYGNQDLLNVNEAVRRAARNTGRTFSFTIIKDRQTEKQYHTSRKIGQGPGL